MISALSLSLALAPSPALADELDPIDAIPGVTTTEEAEPQRRDFSTRAVSSTRYLYAPSAIPMRKGQVNLSQRGLVFTSAAVGLTNNITVLAGTIAPLALSMSYEGDWDNMVAVAGLKIGASIGDQVYVAVGGEVMTIFGWTGGIVFTTATLGDYDRNLSLGAGLGFNTSTGGLSMMPVTLSGFFRLNDELGLISENWVLLPMEEGFGGVQAYSFGVRILRSESFTLDIAGILVGTGTPGVDGEMVPIPLPWIDLTWHFQSRRGA